MKTTLLILAMFLSMLSFGQQTNEAALNVYDSKMLHPYSNSRWMQGKVIIKNKELRVLLRSHPSSAAEYKAYRKNNRIGNVFYILGLGAWVGGFLLVPPDENMPLGLLGGAVATTLGSIPFFIKADRSLHKAVRLYNRAVLAGDSAEVPATGR